jgi:UDP-N-acetylglucosamine 4,6-dehydratase
MKTILITGGSGFLGKNLAKAFKSDYNVILGSRNNKQNLATKLETGCEVVPLDITNIESVRDAVNSYKPDIIIHAAATKFVDLSEVFPNECVDINVVGSQNVARVAIDKGVSTVIGVSTDKAAPPVRNTYGMSKAIMERIFCSLDSKQSNTRFMCVRYGNVVWSTGSVLPIFKKMHEENNHLVSTGPEMRRFFFTVKNAVCLVQTALANINKYHGQVLSREMKSAMMRDILDVIVKNKGGTWAPGETRPGERNDEFLIGELELPYTESIIIDNIKHYLISFNNKKTEPLHEIVSSENVEHLTQDEILSLVNEEW